ncbi:MAG: PEP-CTERM sorting domain-containing protein [Pirellulales bacterium]
MRTSTLLSTISMAAAVLSASWGWCGTYTAPITGLDQANPNGDYLTGEFDFVKSFAKIEQVMIEFVMPEGYEGTFVTTGNSSWSRMLFFLLQDGAEPIDFEATPPFSLPFSTATRLSSSQFRVSPQTATNAQFNLGTLCFPDAECPEPIWPDFLVAGQGRVAFVDVNQSSYHPLPTGAVMGSSTSYLSPGEVTAARVIIVGTLVPEPHSILLLGGLGCAMIVSCRNRRPRG